MTRLRHGPLTFLCALTVLAATQPAAAQTLGQGSGVELPWWRVVGALAICTALAVAAALLLKKYMRGGGLIIATPQRKMQLVDTLRLSHQIDLCVIHYGDKELLVAASAAGASLLASSDRIADAAQPE